MYRVLYQKYHKDVCLCGRSKCVVSKHCQGCPHRHEHIHEDAIEMILNGVHFVEIAEKYGVSRQAVWLWANRYRYMLGVDVSNMRRFT